MTLSLTVLKIVELKLIYCLTNFWDEDVLSFFSLSKIDFKFKVGDLFDRISRIVSPHLVRRAVNFYLRK